MKSMTGYGEAQVESDGIFVRVEATSVNSRHHHIDLNLSDYPRFEQQVKQQIRKRIERGKVEVQFHSNMIGKSEETVEFDEEMVNFFIKKMKQISNETNDLKTQVTLDGILELPGVLKTRRDPLLEDQAEHLFLEALDQSLDELIRMRSREGKAIAQDLSERVNNISEELDSIEKQIPIALDRYRENLLEQMEEILALSDPEIQERLENEIKMYADKCDISEEVVRIRSHLEQFRSYLDSSDAVGKSLEFLLQEIQREINTVGAKANDAEISQRAVDVKTELEKCREQVKNVE